MRRNKRIICGLLAGVMLLSSSFAEDTAPEETAVVTAEPTKAPTAEPTQEPTQVPTAEPTQEPEQETVIPTQEPSQTPEAAPEQETTDAPTAEPTLEITAEPTAEPEASAEPGATSEPVETEDPEATSEPDATAEPTETPSATTEPEETIAPTASVDPTITPEPTATPQPADALEISVEGKSNRDEDGTYAVQMQSPEDRIVFVWTQVSGAEAYQLIITDESGTEKYSAVLTENRLSLRAADYSEGRFILKVSAISAEAVLVEDEIAFRLSQQQMNSPGGGRKPGGSGRFSGSRPSSGASGGAAVPEGFQIVPGEAFAATHASGTKDMQLYGTVELSVSEESMMQLVLDDTAMDIGLIIGDEFSVSLQEKQLVLISDEDGWQISQSALGTLNKSGVDMLVLSGETEIHVPTDFEFAGSVYGDLRSRGYVSKDFVLLFGAEEIMVRVDDNMYRLTDGELEQIG